MTLTEFRERTTEVFGRVRGEYLVRGHHLRACDGLTAEEAVERGDDVKGVWLALCEEFDVPELSR